MEEKMRILAVDDNVINLATIEQELKNRYQVITVNSGVRAIRYLKKERPDLILLDVQMALLDGIETLKEIRALENGASIPVIMLTSRKDRETVIEGTRLGILDYVLKPFSSQDLHARIDRALKRVGVVPLEDMELYEKVKGIHDRICQRNRAAAIAEIEDILNYNIEDEISGRLLNARSKLSASDEVTAERLILRIMQMYEKRLKLEVTERKPIIAGEVNARLLYILNDLENYNIRDASQKVVDLMRFDVPVFVEEACREAQERLEEYDDGAAEELIQHALEEMKNHLI